MATRTVAILLFPGFELLDVFGPAEMFGVLRSHYQVRMTGLGSAGTAVASRQGPQVLLDHQLGVDPAPELLLVPGGQGTREAVNDPVLVSALATAAEAADKVLTVCTGTALLARTGLLDQRRATSNKLSFQWVAEQRAAVHWQAQARWVHDGKYWTSGGVAAGMDMALAVVADEQGDALASDAARYTEYDWHRDADWDPFAALAGLGTNS